MITGWLKASTEAFGTIIARWWMDAWSSFIIFLSEKKPLKKTFEDWVEWLTKLVTPYHHSFSLNSNTKDPSFLNNPRFRYSIRLFHEHFSLIIIFHECSTHPRDLTIGSFQNYSWQFVSFGIRTCERVD